MRPFLIFCKICFAMWFRWIFSFVLILGFVQVQAQKLRNRHYITKIILGIDSAKLKDAKVKYNENKNSLHLIHEDFEIKIINKLTKTKRDKGNFLVLKNLQSKVDSCTLLCGDTICLYWVPIYPLGQNHRLYDQARLSVHTHFKGTAKRHPCRGRYEFMVTYSHRKNIKFHNNVFLFKIPACMGETFEFGPFWWWRK